jgi:hypothetical protein
MRSNVNVAELVEAVSEELVVETAEVSRRTTPDQRRQAAERPLRPMPLEQEQPIQLDVQRRWRRTLVSYVVSV